MPAGPRRAGRAAAGGEGQSILPAGSQDARMLASQSSRSRIRSSISWCSRPCVTLMMSNAWGKRKEIRSRRGGPCPLLLAPPGCQGRLSSAISPRVSLPCSLREKRGVEGGLPENLHAAGRRPLLCCLEGTRCWEGKPAHLGVQAALRPRSGDASVAGEHTEANRSECDARYSGSG